jgi:AcrR family transcriptional regulator
MSGQERREQLIDVGRSMFAQKGFQTTSIEEIAQRAKITKPLVYEHFGGKQGLYAVVVDREVKALLDRITDGLDAEHSRLMLEQAALAFLGYIQDNPEGFRVLVRDSPVPAPPGPWRASSTMSHHKWSTSWSRCSRRGSSTTSLRRCIPVRWWA